ncbi:MAG: aldo/keto reductase [Candidatus Dadabacteria bacterium]|nr:aldo/keto reductase [Candidatus Dadabacteria bacterium]NIQ16517.1 aldo/keto reductase [Candidatus Dadabacteria bacterium]
MLYKKLGNTDLEIPEIGLGTWNYKGGVEPLRKGIELGATLIDTAEGYYTEDIVGEAIKDIRDKVIIATKVSGRNLAYDNVFSSCEQSLSKLQTDYIDLYQIHWPNSAYPIKQTMKALEKLIDSGVVRYVGVSNFSVSEFKEAQHYFPNYKIVSNQVLYNLNSREIEYDLLPYCVQNDVSILAYTPLDSGRLCKSSMLTKEKKYKMLDEISNNLKKTSGQVALNWCNSHENVVSIPKSDSVARTVENCGASGWQLSKEQIDILNEIFKL